MPSVPRVRLKGSRAGRASTREARAGRSVERRTAEGGDFGARGIRPLGRRGKSSNAAVAARLVRLHGRHENPRDRTGHVRNPSIPVSCSLLACPLLHFFRLFCVNRLHLVLTAASGAANCSWFVRSGAVHALRDPDPGRQCHPVPGRAAGEAIDRSSDRCCAGFA